MRFLRIAAVAFITGLSGAMMPGPLLVLVIGQTSAEGFIAVPGLLLGHALLELVTVLLIIVGLQVALQRRAVRGAIGLMGGAALAWMGTEMIREASVVALDVSSSPACLWLVEAGHCRGGGVCCQSLFHWLVGHHRCRRAGSPGTANGRRIPDLLSRPRIVGFRLVCSSRAGYYQ